MRGAARRCGERLLRAARSYFALESALDLPWLKARVQAAPRRGRWERLALTGLEEDLAAVLRRLAAAAMRAGIGGDDPPATQQSVEAWLDGTLLAGLRRYRALVNELHQAGEADLAMLTVAVRTLGGACAAQVPMPSSAAASPVGTRADVPRLRCGTGMDMVRRRLQGDWQALTVQSAGHLKPESMRGQAATASAA